MDKTVQKNLFNRQRQKGGITMAQTNQYGLLWWNLWDGPNTAQLNGSASVLAEILDGRFSDLEQNMEQTCSALEETMNQTFSTLTGQLTALGSTDAQLQLQLNNKLQLVEGSYQGNDGTQTISLPLAPKLLILGQGNGLFINGGVQFSGFFLPGIQYRGFHISGATFTVTDTPNYQTQFNASAYTYRYAAIG